MSFIKSTDNYFPELLALRDHWETIAEEMTKAPLWMSWYSDAKNEHGDCLFLTGDWTVCPVYFGRSSPEDVARIKNSAFRKRLLEVCATLPELFPETTALLEWLPTINYAAFSKLAPRSQLETHRHDNPDSLILHMGLQIPRHCGLQVGNEEHIWRKPGDIVIFDDTQAHSAWNYSDDERVVLYVDFKHESKATQ